MQSNIKAHLHTISDTIKTVIREQAKIVILEDDPDTLESLYNLFTGDGYNTCNIFAYQSVEELIKAISLKSCPPIADIDLFSTDQYIANKTTGINFILALQAKHLILEKHRFILVSGQASQEDIDKCPLIYEVFDKGTMNTSKYYAAVEAALTESFSVKYQLQDAANQEYGSITPHVDLPLTGDDYVQYKKTLRLFDEWFALLTKKLSPLDQNHQRFISMKNKFLTTIDYFFTNTTDALPWPVKDSLQKENLAHLAITALLNEPSKDPTKTLARRKKFIAFLLQEYKKNNDIYYREILPASLKKVHQWLTLAEQDNCFTMKRKYSSEEMLSRLAAIFYINSLRHKDFAKQFAARIDDLIYRLNVVENKGFDVPAHKFKNNNILFEDLTGFVQKLFD